MLDEKNSIALRDLMDDSSEDSSEIFDPRGSLFTKSASDFLMVEKSLEDQLGDQEEDDEEVDSHVSEISNRINTTGMALCILIIALPAVAIYVTFDAVVGNDTSSHSSPAIIHNQNLARCTEKYVDTVLGWTDCEEACLPFYCCFIPSAAVENCVESNWEVCNRYYEPCSLVFGEQEYVQVSNIDEQLFLTEKEQFSEERVVFSEERVVPAPLNIAKICDLAMMETSVDIFTQCQQICLHAKCCFTSSSKNGVITSCKESNIDTCPQYSPCSKIPYMFHEKETDVAITDIAHGEDVFIETAWKEIEDENV